MSNILVLGVGPLPVDVCTRLHAPGMRTWQIVKLLAARRHEVCVGLIRFGDFTGKAEGRIPPHMEEAGPNIRIYNLNYHPKHSAEALATLHGQMRFSCCISTTDIMNSVAAGIPARLPLWLDYNGDPFAEKQLQGAVHDNDATLLKQWRMYLAGLLAGDRFSTSSEPQKHALIGHLAFAGRLNQHTAGEEMVWSVPNCSRAIRDMGLPRNFLVKGAYIPTESFMVLWSGGYNTWSDPETLFRGLEKAMGEDPSIYFVSTGGAIEGHDTLSFERFQKLVEASEHAKRFRFLGWRESDEIPAFYRQADAAIVTDRFSYEGELGARTRINDWMDFGIPVICTRQCELTRELAGRGLAYVHEPGDADGLARALLAASTDREGSAKRAAGAREYFNGEMDEERVFEPMMRWAENPGFAGDRRDASAKTVGDFHVAVDSGLSHLLARQLGFSAGEPASKGRAPLWRRVVRRLKGAR